MFQTERAVKEKGDAYSNEWYYQIAIPLWELQSEKKTYTTHANALLSPYYCGLLSVGRVQKFWNEIEKSPSRLMRNFSSLQIRNFMLVWICASHKSLEGC